MGLSSRLPADCLYRQDRDQLTKACILNARLFLKCRCVPCIKARGHVPQAQGGGTTIGVPANTFKLYIYFTNENK